MQQAIDVLRSKGVALTEAEAEGVCLAILLHDIGHGPFSHTLEHTLMQVTHESVSIHFMEHLNEQFDGQLDLAIKIFKGHYHKPFLHQLVSGQLDMDRMDYLNRDSFFTGVHEGVIGYDRIIKMLSVSNGELVVEEKGIYSIEKFLIARRLMYWQVYLHKTVLSAEQMLIATFQRAKALSKAGVRLPASDALQFFLHHQPGAEDFLTQRDELLTYFAALDDFDIIFALKSWRNIDDRLLAYFSEAILDRKLFRLEFSDQPFDEKYVNQLKQKVLEWSEQPASALEFLFIEGKESNSAYRKFKDEIKILFKDGRVKPMSKIMDQYIPPGEVTKYYLCYPKI
jgi:HD superfamily phosphohydrolase